MDFNRLIRFFEERHIEYKLNEIIASYVSFKVGGEAVIMAMPSSYEQLCDAVRFAYLEKIPYFILGNGTNVYFSSEGYTGLVILTKRLNKIEVDGCSIKASCGASLTQLSVLAKEESLCGLEFAYGIPASCGGAVYMNASAYGGEISKVVSYSTVYDPKSDKKIQLTNQEHLFERKSSIFKGGDYVLLETCFLLKKGRRAEIDAFMKSIIHKRKESQPLDLPSAGSVFVGRDGQAPSYLIDKCGLKGKTIGGAQVSNKHAGFIVNVNNATSRDINELISYIKKCVEDKYGVSLKEEIIFVK